METLDVAELGNYEGVLLGAKPIGDVPGNVLALTAYVNGGGNVYVFGGTDFYGSIAQDGVVLNSFLNPFGLGISSSMTVFRGSYSVNGSHPVLSGVDALFADNGTGIFDLNGGDPRNEVLAFHMGDGVVAVYDGSIDPTSVSTVEDLIGPITVRPFPNPARNSMNIMFSLSAHGRGDLRVYNITGQLVHSLPLRPAAGVTTWDGRDSSGRVVSPGTYFLRLMDGEKSETARVTLIR